MQHSLNKKREQIYAILSQIKCPAALMFCLCNVASVTDFHDNTEKKHRQKSAENKTTAKGGDALDFISQILLLQVTPRDDAHITELSGCSSPMEWGQGSAYL